MAKELHNGDLCDLSGKVGAAKAGCRESYG